MTHAPRWNHAFTIGFEVISRTQDAEDVTAACIRRAVIAKLANSTDMEVIENAGAPFDTYQVDDPACSLQEARS